jgi:hypothetical protein
MPDIKRKPGSKAGARLLIPRPGHNRPSLRDHAEDTGRNRGLSKTSRTCEAITSQLAGGFHGTPDGTHVRLTHPFVIHRRRVV